VSTQCVIGVDLGGTNVRAGAFYDDGSSAGPSYSNPSNAQQGTSAIVHAIANTVTQAVSAAESKPVRIGLAVPGHIDDANGMVVWAPNFGHEEDGVFHYWKDVPLGAMLQKEVELPVRMGNDANLAALGEYRFGTGRNSAKCLVMLTIGTGIGGGVIMSPSAVQGDARGPLVLVGGNKGGAELGHIIVAYGGLDCNAGSYGALEGYCQRDSIITRAQHRLRRGRQSVLQEKPIGKLTPLDLSDAADSGDALAIEVWDEVGEMLGAGIGTLINVFAPDVFAIGGQIAKAGHWLLDPAIRSAENVAVPSLFRDAKITLAEQIDDAGMLGGAALALEAS
jgi:glucokinase